MIDTDGDGQELPQPAAGTRPAADTSGPLTVRLSRAMGEAIVDAVAGPDDIDWPAEWPSQREALESGQEAITEILNDGTGPANHCECCLGHRRTQLDAEEHHRILTASQTPGIEFAAVGTTLHQLGCHVALWHGPLYTEPGGWHSRRRPAYLRGVEGQVWLGREPKRKACREDY